MVPSKPLVVNTGFYQHKYFTVPVETIAEESLINGVGSGDSIPFLLGDKSFNVRYDKPAGSLPKRVGGCVHPVPVGGNDIGRPEGETASLGYHSITYTASENSHEPLPLSELIEISRRSAKLSYSDWNITEKFKHWAEVTENYWISIKTIKPNCKCVPGKFWGYTHEARPLHNRFSYPRRSRKLAMVHEIMRFEESLGTKEFTLLTLTASHNGGWRSTMDRLRPGRGRLLKIIRKYFPNVRYVWIAEPHNDKDNRGNVDLGYPHIHIVLMGRIDNTVKDSQGRGLEDKLREYWSEKWKLGSHTFGLDFEVIEDREKALNYILKYVGKSYANKRGWSKAELIFNMNLYGAMSDEINPMIYRTFGMSSKAYGHLFPHSKKEPSVTLDARLFPISDESDLPVKNCMKAGPRPQLIPDWLGNLNLIELILKAAPDYTTRFKYDPHGKPLPRPPNHWGRPCEGLR